MDWVRVNREDGETVGWLEPLDAGYASLRPRDVLGHVAGEDAGWIEAEEAVHRVGLAHVAEEWLLDGGEERFVILEVTPTEIVLGNALASKALVRAERRSIAWPDTGGRLRRTGR